MITLTPSKLAELTGRKISTVSIHLAKLRAADVVRYEGSRTEDRGRRPVVRLRSSVILPRLASGTFLQQAGSYPITLSRKAGGITGKKSGKVQIGLNF